MRARWVRHFVYAVSTVLLLLLLAGPGAAQTPAPSEGQASEGAEVEAAAESVRGILRQPGEEGEDDIPVEGAQIIIRSDGQEVGTAVTGADGTFELGLPGPGDYEAELVLESLPEGATLTSEAEDANILAFSIAPGQNRTLLFRLGEAAAGGGGFLRSFLQLSVEGIKLGTDREPRLPPAGPHELRPADEPRRAGRRRPAGRDRGVPRRLVRRLTQPSRCMRHPPEHPAAASADPRSGGIPSRSRVCCTAAETTDDEARTAWKTPGGTGARAEGAVTRPHPPPRRVRSAASSREPVPRSRPR
jgi:hypothetical protein